MPQLDQFTYLTQFVWLCVFYMTFYILLYNDGLPKVSRILKLRAYLTSSKENIDLSKISSDKQSVSNGFFNSFDDVLKECFHNSISYLYSSSSSASKWCHEIISNLNISQLGLMNKSYVRSLGEITISQIIKYYALNNISPLTKNRNIVYTTQTNLNINQIFFEKIQKKSFERI
uniref:H(+)-transporting two-sector ATPase n=1 Tax=Roya obtusa TaxID=104537 RepID=U5YGV0_9VIRI|nr:ATP synthase F0 subunit 8 [Roya obtusa]AGZ90365.1 ATP synthase F0 subunit 8 [Roya obtusa]